MLSMSVDGINFIGQFQSVGAIIDVAYNQHKLTTIFVGEFEHIAPDTHTVDHNFYTHWEMDHKVRVILRNCVWNRIPGVPTVFQEVLVKEFDKLAYNWLKTYGYVGRAEQAITIRRYTYREDSEFGGGRFEEVIEK